MTGVSLRQAIRSGVLLAAASLLAACGGEQKQAEPAGEAERPTGQTASERPASFGLCMMCHSDAPGKNGLGPSLFGIVGRKAAEAPGFSYSPAMKAANVTWDEATLDRFMQHPRDVVPGTKMSYAGLNDPEKRAEITRYLATLK